MKYTPFIKFNSLFNLILSVSSLDSHGFLTMDNAHAVLSTKVIDFITADEFWRVSAELLSRKNHKIAIKREREIKRGGRTR